MLEYAKLDKKALVVGIGDHFEIWNPVEWNKYLKQVRS